MSSIIRWNCSVFYLAWLILSIALLMITTHPGLATQTIIQVSTADELKQALKDVQPGQTIKLADGIYTGNFVATRSGTASQPIYLQGSRDAHLENGSLANGYGFYLDKVKYWTLTGFTIQNSAKGVMFDNADHNILERLLIENIGQEGVHFRTCSADNILQNSMIRNTGMITPGMGEGVYIGSDSDNWLAYSCDADERDKSHNNQILNNAFGPDVRAEAIDAKEGTKGGRIIGNHFDATGLSGENSADSWVDMKGNQYEVAQNEGHRGNTTQLHNGFETHHKDGADGWGRNNFFYANIVHLDAEGYGFYIDTQDANHGNRVCTNNQVFGAGKGVANIPLTGTPRSSSASTQIDMSAVSSEANQFTPTATIWLPLITKPPCT